jgi:hypothetical protein
MVGDTARREPDTVQRLVVVLPRLPAADDGP